MTSQDDVTRPLREQVARALGARRGHTTPWTEDYDAADAVLSLPLLAAVREQALADAEQAVREAWADGHPALIDAFRNGAAAARQVVLDEAEARQGRG